MKLQKKHLLLPGAAVLFLVYSFTHRRNVAADILGRPDLMEYAPLLGFAVADTNDPDSILKYPFNEGETGGVYGNEPGNYKEDVVFDQVSGNYFVYRRYGRFSAAPPVVMTPEEYRAYVAQQQAKDYWDARSKSEAAQQAEGRDPASSIIPQITIDSEGFARIFGSNTIDIRPQGFAELTFGGRFQKIDNPIIPERNRNVFTFNFDQRIQMNVNGSIGEKLKLNVNYDTEATFAFENQVKVEFTGLEDDIIKKIEVGNVNLPLNSSLITGAQSLFGVKGQFQFGKLMLTGVFSEQRSQSSSINIQGGATTTDFEIWGDQYEANRHYFLSHYFRDNYEEFLQNSPLITSPVQITKVEVWVTNNRQNTQDTRNIVALLDLGERQRNAYRDPQRSGPAIFPGQNGTQFPDNLTNQLDPQTLAQNYPGIRDISQVNAVLTGAGFNEATEFVELANARKLNPNEFNFHPQLGYITLNTSLNQDEVLAVAFQYTAGGRTFQVGEFSTDGVSPPSNLVVKMLKSFILDVRVPNWDLMMKNVYSLSAFQVGAEDFRLQVLYQNDETGTPVPFLPESSLRSELLLRVMELDRLNQNSDDQPDGFFDFIPNITITPQNGRIIFPVLEPFGSNLSEKLSTEEERDKFVFQELYDSTRFVAQNETRKNKYLIRGQFKSSSSSEIQLNAFNIPPGSVQVTAGGTRLIEGQDYRVDYNLGRVTILNEGILNSGVPIKVDFENNALFNFQTKTFMGLNAEYRFNENLNLGATMVHLNERPLTQKVNIGDEPISNTIIGLNGNYSKDAPYLTRMVDAIPFISTKESSNLLISGEVAQLIPGSPRGIEINGEQTTFLDDFESSQTTIDIRNPSAWRLASTPAGQTDIFPESSENTLAYGFNRARLAWYTIDPLFHNDEARTPSNIRGNKDLQSTNDVREVLVDEVFPNLELDNSQPRNIATLDLAFYPRERGPYNYDVEATEYSAGINQEGNLRDPASRWGGIMRDISVTNFEEQNIEFIQFWMLNPFVGNDGDAPPGGDLYFNLGSVSEDILRDGVQAIENSIPVNGDLSKLDSTHWGYATNVRPPVVAFDADPSARDLQDVGYDLLNDAQERTWSYDTAYANYVQRILNTFGAASPAYNQAFDDPAADNFQYYQGDNLDADEANILERYKAFNNPQGNSNPTPVGGVSAFATNLPDIEDVNRDQTLSKAETYYQYRISIRPQDLNEVGKNYITDILETTSPVQPNGKTYRAHWVQFKVPVFSPDKRIGPINDFRSIRFIRAFLKNFPDDIVLRFARMELVRGEWRRYQFALDGTRDRLTQDDQDRTIFEVNAVNIEQNGSRSPVPYVLPPGIDRQVLFGTTSANQQNEQALSLRIINLEDGDARAVFRNIDFDMRLYKRLKLFTHLESATEGQELRDGDLTVFIRLGSDYDQNFYEYEIPMTVTPWNVSNTDVNLIWPAENQMDFALDVLKQVKLERNKAYRTSGDPLNEPYTVDREGGKVTVVGAPNLGNVRTILIGVRNPKKRFANDGTDNLPKDVEVWINELRLTDFDQDGGWAANARIAAKLADFANVSLTGSTSSIGWGSLDQSVSEFQQEQRYAYDLQSNVELGKFFNKDLGIRIPMFFGTSETWINPRFNPLDLDIEFDDALNNIEDPQDQDSLREATQDYTRRRSLNFTNVRKERNANKNNRNPQIYDIENFAVSYSFSETFRRNINTRFDINRQHTGNINYTYRARPKPIKPFNKVSWLQNNAFALIRDFNFYPYPKSFTAIASFDRNYTAMQMRNTDAILNDIPAELLGNIEATYNKNFNLNRQYNLLYDITEALRFDFAARAGFRVDETAGDPNSQANRDTIIQNLRDFGRPMTYHQQVTINWQVPINKLPLMDFATLTATYNGDYDWQAPSLATTRGNTNSPGNTNFNLNFGNTIQNNSQIQLNSTLNFNALYNKVPYLKKALNGGTNTSERRRPSSVPTPGRRNNEQSNENEKEEELTAFDKILMGGARFLMMVKSGSVNYSQSDGQVLPGFRYSPTLLGLSEASAAPGFWFTMGGQTDIRRLAAANNWLLENPNLNTQYAKTSNTNLNMRLTVEPINALRIVLTAQTQGSSNLSSFFRADSLFDPVTGDFTNYTFRNQNEFETRTFSTSWFMMNTAFETLSAPEYNSATYDAFRDNRLIISQRLAQQQALVSPDDTARYIPGYTPELVGNADSANYGYRYFSVSSQDVLIPAFVAAYSGTDANTVPLDFERTLPLPNWQITYDGLSKIEFLKKYFASFTLNHAYRSTYTVAGISTNLLRQKAVDDRPGETPLNPNGDLLPNFQINSINMTEQFAPLIGLNTKLKNNMTLRVEYKSDRNMMLSLTNNQITENRGSEWVIGAGYIIKDVKLRFVRVGSRRTNPVSNLELRADVGIRDNIILIRRILEDVDQPTSGQRVTTVKVSADYRLSQRIQTKLFYDLNMSRFKTSNAFPLTTNQFGISVRLNLGQ